jgi:hypothetical protein
MLRGFKVDVRHLSLKIVSCKDARRNTSNYMDGPNALGD